MWGADTSLKDATQAVGKTIASIGVVDDTLRLSFEDGSTLTFTDNGQSCCEYRYMHCDDDLSYYIGATYIDAQVQDGPDIVGDYDRKDCQFLVVYTSRGDFRVTNYNEHNGYYGGFAVQAEFSYAPTY